MAECCVLGDCDGAGYMFGIVWIETFHHHVPVHARSQAVVLLVGQWQGCESHATPVGMPVLSEFERIQDHDPAGCVCFIAFQRDADAEVRHGIGHRNLTVCHAFQTPHTVHGKHRVPDLVGNALRSHKHGLWGFAAHIRSLAIGARHVARISWKIKDVCHSSRLRQRRSFRSISNHFATRRM